MMDCETWKHLKRSEMTDCFSSWPQSRLFIKPKLVHGSDDLYPFSRSNSHSPIMGIEHSQKNPNTFETKKSIFKPPHGDISKTRAITKE